MDSTSYGHLCHDTSLTVPFGRKAVPSYSATDRPRNRLLAALPQETLSEIKPYLDLVRMERGGVICEADRPPARVYFMEAGTVSLVAMFQARPTVEMATVGQEGMVGIGTILGGESLPVRHVSSMSGLALTIEVLRFRTLLQDSPALRATCSAYAEAFLREGLQTAACNSVHTVEERCARSLLTSHDRSEGDTITLTQDCLAKRLGVCRSTVTLVAGALQKAELIRYRRGTITVVDRPGLEAVSCECYRVIRDHYQRLLPLTYGRQLL